MATILGRMACFLCGFGAAHVKRSDGKRPYVHCPECGVMTHAKSGHQERLMLERSKPEAPAPGALPEPPATDRPIIVRDGVKVAHSAARPAPAAPAAPAKPASWVDQLLGSGK
jgi:hypothetical protein